MTAYYKIAEIIVRFEGQNAELNRVTGFRPFRIEHDGEADATIRLDSSLEEFDFDSVEWIYTSGEDGVSYDFGRHADGFCCRIGHSQGGRLRMWHRNDSTTLWCNADYVEDFNPYELRFLLWIAFGLVALPHDAVAVHTSVIMLGERAYMFLGESGTGKSTHTRLWRTYIEGAELLNDDSPILRVVDGQPVVYGSPWSGKTPCYKPLCRSLGGVTRLSQAPHNSIHKLGRIRALGALLPSCPPNFAYDERLIDRMCNIIAAVIRTTPVYHLECLPDRAAAELSFNTMNNG